ncbi:MAG: hypothetical protein ACE3L7_25060 [Candidatus Pristimantibacillus sp.]
MSSLFQRAGHNAVSRHRQTLEDGPGGSILELRLAYGKRVREWRVAGVSGLPSRLTAHEAIMLVHV